ncbi:hypothetical protein [Methylobacterium sp. Leaf123]|uniref:hypothetical protein n=1 Tax=Methylobacterium sp. Leaf123 TaxID=1736264 RepID=UPI0009EA3D37|nr:hypothetical protein [Methylobacterium sp. Leaf123]
MPSFDVAHLHKQGQDMIIFPLDRSFGYKSDREQSEILAELEERANNAGLRGTAVAVWDGGGGRSAFRAPRPWHPFFSTFGLRDVLRNVNKQISW